MAGGNIWGMDLEGVEKLAKDFESQAKQLEQIRLSVDTAVRSVAWQGGDRVKFNNDWANVGAKNLTECQTGIEKSAGILRAQAKEQLRASTSFGDEGAFGNFMKEVTYRAQDVIQNASEAIKLANELRERAGRWSEMSPGQAAADINAMTREEREALMKMVNPETGQLYADEMMKYKDDLNAEALRDIRDAQYDAGRGSIPVRSATLGATVEANAYFVKLKGGLEASSVTHADGTVTVSLQVSAAAGVGADGKIMSGGVEIEGRAAREVTFKSQAEYEAYMNGLLRDLPPDSLGELGTAVSAPAGYLLAEATASAETHGGQVEDTMTGALKAHGKIDVGAGEIDGSAEIAVQKNLTNGNINYSATIGGSAEAGGLGGGVTGGFNVATDASGKVEALTFSREVNNTHSGVGAATVSTVTIPMTPENTAKAAEFMQAVKSGDLSAMDRIKNEMWTSGSESRVTYAIADTEFDGTVAGNGVTASASTRVATSIEYRGPNDTEYTTRKP